MTASILPPPRTVFLDQNATPLVGGTVATYVPNTTTPKTSWQDSGQTILNTNPIILDSLGSCLLYGSGQYTLTVKDVSGNLIYTGLTTAPGGAAGGTYLNLITQFGAVGDGTTDDTTAVQNALTYIASTGGCLYVPRGLYRLTSSVSANWTNAAYLSTQRPAIIGDGSGLSVFIWDGISAPSTFMMSLTRTDTVAQPASAADCTIQGIGFAPITSAKNYYTSGLYLSKWPFLTMSDVTCHRLQTGLYLDQVLSSQFNRLVIANNNYGLYSIGAPSSSNSALYSNNALTFLACIVGGNNLGGISMIDTAFSFIGGSIEDNANSSTGGAGYGAYVSNTGNASAVTAVFEQVYIEGNGTTGNAGSNGATADVWINHDPAGASNSYSYAFRDCFFNRLPAAYCPYNIYLNIVSNVQAPITIQGNQFQSNGYTASSSRPVVYFNNGGGGLANVKLLTGGNGYGNSIEAPDFASNTNYYNGLGYAPGALMIPSSAQSIPNATNTVLTFATTSYNNYSIWSSGTPTRLTVPANVETIRLSGAAFTASGASPGSLFKLDIQKNGSFAYQVPASSTTSVDGNSSQVALNVCSAPISVTAGDYFELVILQNTGGSFSMNSSNLDATWFCMEIIF